MGIMMAKRRQQDVRNRKKKEAEIAQAQNDQRKKVEEPQGPTKPAQGKKKSA